MASSQVAIILFLSINTWYCIGAEQLLRGLEPDSCRLFANAQPLDYRR